MSAFPYQTQAVRDLAWACFWPPLLCAQYLPGKRETVADCRPRLTAARRDWLARLDRDPQPLLAHLAGNRSHRLGVYFERLWHFFLEQDAAFDLVAHNLAVRDRGTTVGEFDIIYWCRERQRHCHLELAVKYFLGSRIHTPDEAASRWCEWLGPDTRDRLDLKLRQLLGHQTGLGQHPLARAQLRELGIGEMSREIAFKGYLFQAHGEPLPPPPGFNPELGFSHWVHLEGLRQFLAGIPAEQFQLLSKMRWLSPLRACKGEQFLGRSMLLERLQSQPGAQLVAAVDPDGLELCRFFVTPDDWPATAG
ncbi:MAG: DUF1853 family protein [Halieaceae bacterium]|jgi:hypothetical protein|nr:DUF1853 family protein [Halieaceae bacterium]